MVIVRLIGGLGNQFFQYAAARRLAIWHQTELKLDISPFEYYKRRSYSLGSFSIQETFATAEEVAKLKGAYKKGFHRIIFRMIQKLKPYYRESIFFEPHVTPYNPNFLKTPEDVYLEGYWQSERYFAQIETIIRREFTLRREPGRASKRIAESIARTQSVSVHVRRGEYISDPKTNHLHGTCSLEYYEKSAELMAQKINNPHFFVFSDDPDWVIQNLHLSFPTNFDPTLSFTHNDPSKSYADLMWLMSTCDHHIIANSTFSWWAAWLCQNPKKIVIAPGEWFRDPKREVRDIIPDHWYKVRME